MTSKKKVKRKLKKRVMIALTVAVLILSTVFVGLVKGISDDSLGKNAPEKESASKLESSEKKEDISESEEANENKEANENSEKEEDNKKKDKPVVIIDPTFGGEYAGSKGYDGVLQKDVNLGIALKVKEAMQRYDDVEVYLTREDDSTVPYEKRVSLIKEKNADIVVSIQQNTEGSGKAQGVETYILSKDTYPNRDGKLGYALQKSMLMYSTSVDRGVMARNTDILKDSYSNGAVSALIYTGFITNEAESKKLTTDTYIERLGEGIAQGILSYIDTDMSDDE